MSDDRLHNDLFLKQFSSEPSPDRQLEPLKPHNKPFEEIIIESEKEKKCHDPDHCRIKQQGSYPEVSQEFVGCIKMSPSDL